MKKVKIDFSIKSTDNNLEFQTVGEHKNDRLKFIDPDENTNYIVFHGENIEYYKKGNVSMKYKFDTSSKTKGTYEVMGNKFSFDIITKKLIESNDNIYIEFDLYQGNDLVNNSTLIIAYQEE